MSKLQSAYHKFHSLKTALLCVLNDIFASLGAGYSTVHLLLDLSAAFGIVDHSILTHCLQRWLGISSTAVYLLSSFLSNRSQTVITLTSKSQPVLMEYGVPRGSVLGTFTLFIIYNSTSFHYIKISWPLLPFLCK